MQTDSVFSVPSSVAVCPYCNAPLSARAFTFSRIDGKLKALAVATKCSVEPTPGSGQWLTWHKAHSKNPMLYQLPIEHTVKAWINSQFDFDP